MLGVLEEPKLKIMASANLLILKVSGFPFDVSKHVDSYLAQEGNPDTALRNMVSFFLACITLPEVD